VAFVSTSKTHPGIALKKILICNTPFCGENGGFIKSKNKSQLFKSYQI
jgi:hypothetical protein